MTGTPTAPVVGMIAQVLIAAFTIAATLAVPDRLRGRVAGGGAVLLGLAGMVTGAAAWLGPVDPTATHLALRTSLAGLRLLFAPDPLGGAFLVLVSGVGAVAALWGSAGSHGPANSRTSWSAFVVFLLGLQAVFCAADVVAFLLAWELMAVASTVLVFTEQAQRAEVASAGLWYAVMTHLSFLLLLGGFAVLAAEAPDTSFAALAAVPAESTATGIAVVLVFAGAAVKAGLVPLHVWLPRAHPEAPSHVSALMSAGMVKAGVYALLLVTVRLLPDGPDWWGLVLMALGAISAVFGILQASVTSDLKRLLAYSTTENIGLITVAIGTAQLLHARGATAMAEIAAVAALLLVVAHAAAKTGLFLGAGSVLHATGHRDLDSLGGLARAMPWTTVGFGVCALGAAALPPTVGFVAEWTLFQALIHGARPDDSLVAMAMPVAVAAVALTAGLALLTFVKAFGIAFLGRARSPAAAEAHEVGIAERAALGVAAFAVLALGLAPGPVAGAAARALGYTPVTTTGLLGLGLPELTTGVDPIALTGVATLLGTAVLLVQRAMGRRAPRRRVEAAWGCGGLRTSPRMQYTATSYAEPLVRVFDSTLAATRSVETVPAGTSPYLEHRVRFRQRVTDVVDFRLYTPVLTGLHRVGRLARRVQNGSINRYLSFSFAALLAVLAVVTW